MNKILFTVLMNNALETSTVVSIDTFYPLKIDDADWELIQRIDALKELSAIPEHIQKTESEINSYVSGTKMRLRFNPAQYQHILMVTLPEDTDITRDGLQALLDGKTKDELKEFLHEAEID